MNTLCNGCMRLWPCRTHDQAVPGVSDIALLPRSNKLAVASVDRSITFYDIFTFDVASKISNLEYATMSMCYVEQDEFKRFL